MPNSPHLDVFFAQLQAAQSECDVIDAELSQLNRDDPGDHARSIRLTGQRWLIGERLLATIEVLESGIS